MKRYWLLIVLVPLIVASIGVYYIQAAALYPQFVLEKLAGDETEAEAVQLSGQFGQNLPRDSVTIGTKGSEYGSAKSLFAGLAPYWGREEIGRLAEQHRSFMRGKRASLSFYEDAHTLAYANVEGDYSSMGLRNPRFTVALLDKMTGHSSSYETAVPGGNKYSQINVDDVQLVGKKLKVITQNFDSNGQEIHLYSLGLAKGAAPSDQILFHKSGSMEINIGGGYEDNALLPSRYTVLLATEYKKTPQKVGYRMDESGRRLLVFDIQAGREAEINSREINSFLNGVKRQSDISISSHENDLYLAKITANGIGVVHYSIPEAKTTVNEMRIDSVFRLHVKNGRLYALIKKKTDNADGQMSLIVADADTGKLLYKGAVTLRGSQSSRNDALSKLFIYDLVVR